MKKRILWATLFSMLLITTFGYSINLRDPNCTIKLSRRNTDSIFEKNQLKITPLRILRFEYSGIEHSYERMHTQRFSTQISLRYLTDPFHIGGGRGYKGVGFSLEEKFFLIPLKRFKLYISMEGLFDKFTANVQAHFNNEKSVLDSTYRNYLDKFTIKKQAMSLNLKCGIQVFIFKKIVLDAGVGPGVKYRDVTHANRSFPSDVMQHSTNYPILSEGKRFVANCSVGIRVGYVF
jgi:hypothetical protein